MSERFCPNCGSTDTAPEIQDIWGFRGTNSTWNCKNCAYSGIMPRGDPGDYSFDRENDELKGMDFDKPLEKQTSALYLSIALLTVIGLYLLLL
ncbi:MAG: hypothetical protein ACI8Z7_000840 [Candidatus Nanohaloarchaea archaeon]|jgi:hypothetical protein